MLSMNSLDPVTKYLKKGVIQNCSLLSKRPGSNRRDKTRVIEMIFKLTPLRASVILSDFQNSLNSMNFPSFRENSNEPEKSFEIKSEEDPIPNIKKATETFVSKLHTAASSVKQHTCF